MNEFPWTQMIVEMRLYMIWCWYDVDTDDTDDIDFLFVCLFVCLKKRYWIEDSIQIVEYDWYEYEHEHEYDLIWFDNGLLVSKKDSRLIELNQLIKKKVNSEINWLWIDLDCCYWKMSSTDDLDVFISKVWMNWLNWMISYEDVSY